MAVRPKPPKPRATQTRVKHELLEKYLAIWGRIIINGIKNKARTARDRGRTFDMHMVYVDTNAFTGRYDGELEDVAAGRPGGTVYGSAVVGVQALDRLAQWAEAIEVPVRTNTILIEKQGSNFRKLQQTLGEAGFSNRVRQATHFRSLRAGEIAVVQEDWTSLTDDLIAYTQTPYTFALYLIDPYGPMAMPLGCVGKIVRQQHHDVIVNMPYRDLHKKTGLATKRELTPAQREHCKHYDRMFGSTRWQAIVQGINPAIWEDAPSESLLDQRDTTTTRELEEQLSQLYRRALASTDPDVIVKSIRLLFPSHDLTMYYLYLTTHNADGALKMNELIDEAKLKEYRLRESLKRTKREVAAGMNMLPQFATAITPPPDEHPRPDTEVVAEAIMKRCKGCQLTKKALFREMADEPFFASEISKALTHLRRHDLANYEPPLERDSIITFAMPRSRW